MVAVAFLAVDPLHRAHLASVREELRPASSLKAKARRLVRFAHRRDVKKNATKHDLDPSEWFLTLPLNFRELLEIVQLFGMQLGHLVDHENVALAEAPKNNSPISPPPDETQCTFCAHFQYPDIHLAHQWIEVSLTRAAAFHAGAQNEIFLPGRCVLMCSRRWDFPAPASPVRKMFIPCSTTSKTSRWNLSSSPGFAAGLFAAGVVSPALPD